MSTNPCPTSRVPDETRDAAVFCDSRFDSICTSPGVNPRHSKWQKRGGGSVMVCVGHIHYGWCDTQLKISIYTKVKVTEEDLYLLQ